MIEEIQEMKVIKRTRIIGAPGTHFLDVGDVIEVRRPEDDEGMVTIETQSGITGEVLLQNLGRKT